MSEWYRSNSVEFPRHKVYLTSLSQLIDRKVIVQPQAEISKKLFPQRDFAKKLAITHQRTKSSVQLRSRKFDLHWSSKKVKDMVVENNRSPTRSYNKVEIQQQPYQFRSTQMMGSSKKNDCREDPILKIGNTYSTTFPEKYSPESQSNELRLDSPQKNFLRKGSNLQKQIVINLLRSKLIKERQLNEKKQYSNQEILKMIQVFKGVALAEGKMKKGIVSEDSERKSIRIRKRTEKQKELNGWQQDQVEQTDEK